jgi:hypothetical protein
MNTSLLKFVVLVGMLALAACRKDSLGATGVQLDILTGDSRFFASYFMMTWLDDQKQLFQVRVPEAEDAFIDEEQAPAVSVFIALDPRSAGMRRVLVRGYRDGQIISEGAARLLAARNVWVQLGLEMHAAGSLPDQDGDGFPDVVDNCPRERDPCGSTPPGMDAGADDAGPDLGPDLAPDLPGERPLPVMPTSIPDAAPDLGRQDVRSS